MGKTTVSGLLARKLRLVSTALAIVLGVSFVSGVLVLSDTMSKTFDQLFGTVFAGVDVNVRATKAFTDFDGSAVRNPLPDSLVKTASSVPGVQAAEGSVIGFAQLVDKHGTAISPQAPTFGGAWHNVRQLSPFTLRSGRSPARAGEVAIDSGTAKQCGFRVGDRVTVLFEGPAEQFTIVGITKFGTVDNLAGATFASFDSATAQRVLNRTGQFDSIDILAGAGTDRAALLNRVSQAMPAGYEAVSGKQLALENASSVKRGFGFLTKFLLVFAGIAVFVGAFLIANTFSILVAQRTKELALLRALGASRRQIMRSVIAEAVIIGLGSSAAGLALGFGVASGLEALFRAAGMTLPSTGVQLLPHTVIVAFAVGVGVTVLAAVLPARRASKVAPVAAMSDNPPVPAGSLRRRAIAGGALAATAVGAMALGISGGGGGGAALIGLGMVLGFIALAVLAPLAAGPAAAGLGWPLGRLLRVPGGLGRRNAMRSPRRTSATAAALMVGLGVVAMFSVFGSSLKASVGKVFDKELTADYVVHAKMYRGFSPGVEDQLRHLPQVQAVSGLAQGSAKVGSSTIRVSAVDPAGLGRVLKVDMASGQLSTLDRPGALLVDQAAATTHGWKLGQPVEVTFARTGRQQLTLGGIFKPNPLVGNYLVSGRFFQQNFTDHLDFVVLVKAAGGVAPAVSRHAVESTLSAYPNLSVKDQVQIKAEQRAQVDAVLGIVNALLALSVLIALFGIVNTLLLSVFERTRELGLLRAVGMSRRQVRTMISSESVVIALFGTVLGLMAGIGFGVAFVKAQHSASLAVLSVPGAQLASFVLLAVVLGAAAAVWPARRAARLDVLQAIATP